MKSAQWFFAGGWKQPMRRPDIKLNITGRPWIYGRLWIFRAYRIKEAEMLNLNLDEEERTILFQLLENCIGDLRGEIARTENLEYKSMLKQRKEVLKKLLASLQKHAGDAVPNI
jgi:hypothetical protein